ncbi:hypothetical protein SNOG_10718 [Parastagonospora nodorum SN15]|uniref:Uncharacterized protein n=1 Tax=Phaeosphaeria nodorum (strain SN15 / ATCC MYA-4574 / FGSC 10173) TaxID=321614 RepID=Q0UBZ6_PHANO|nr:hypothetical protein SNOG_10718 [Parastagonospora nodorum SN15]EAT82112.1 hypothetical protein SNOG_10718 [Parastagonospora nodorum SN15]
MDPQQCPWKVSTDKLSHQGPTIEGPMCDVMSNAWFNKPTPVLQRL